VVLLNASASGVDVLSVGQDGSAVGLGVSGDFGDFTLVLGRATRDLLDLPAVLRDESSVRRRSHRRSVHSVGEELRVAGDHVAVELDDVLVGVHDLTVDLDQLLVDRRHRLRNGENSLVELAAVFQIFELDLVLHHLLEVDQSRSGGLDVSNDALSVSENVVRVLVGDLSIAQERGVVVLVDQRLVFLNHRSDQIRLSSVEHHLVLDVENLTTIRLDVFLVIFDRHFLGCF